MIYLYKCAECKQYFETKKKFNLYLRMSKCPHCRCATMPFKIAVKKEETKSK